MFRNSHSTVDCTTFQPRKSLSGTKLRETCVHTYIRRWRLTYVYTVRWLKVATYVIAKVQCRADAMNTLYRLTVVVVAVKRGQPAWLASCLQAVRLAVTNLIKVSDSNNSLYALRNECSLLFCAISQYLYKVLKWASLTSYPPTIRTHIRLSRSYTYFNLVSKRSV